ncbi:hypothetical protein GCM10020254_13140 [Streptomyces goshikiensis]
MVGSFSSSSTANPRARTASSSARSACGVVSEQGRAAGQAGGGDQLPHLLGGQVGEDGLADRRRVQGHAHADAGGRPEGLVALQLPDVGEGLSGVQRQVHRLPGGAPELVQDPLDVRRLPGSHEGGQCAQPGARRVPAVGLRAYEALLDERGQDPERTGLRDRGRRRQVGEPVRTAGRRDGLQDPQGLLQRAACRRSAAAATGRGRRVGFGDRVVVGR